MSYFQGSKGLGLVEVVISIFVASVAVLALLSIQDPAWRATAQADLLGRASGIMHHQVESTQAYIVRVCNINGNTADGIPALPVAINDITTATRSVYASGLSSSISGGGDAVFNVTTQIAQTATNYFRVRITVTWAANPTGINQTFFVSRQEYLSMGCPSGT